MTSNLEKFTKGGKFLMLALDHRQSFEKLTGTSDKDKLVEVKKEIIESVYDKMSGILVDQDYGLPAYMETAHEKPFLLPIEESGYTDEEGERVTKLKYTVDELVAAGASGVKLLIYFNPGAKTADKQIETAGAVMEMAKEKGVPYFLEVVTYDLPDLLASTYDAMKMLVDAKVKPDLYKIEYPGSKEMCQRVHELMNGIPWILLTKGDDFEEFVFHLQQAHEAGCSGFLAGRALWQDSLSDPDKSKVAARFKLISEICLQTS
jgi:tagatose 1,6-diphosphate aldolase